MAAPLLHPLAFLWAACVPFIRLSVSQPPFPSVLSLQAWWVASTASLKSICLDVSEGMIGGVP